MKRREVISKCMEMGVPIFNGRIDKTLFVSSLRAVQVARRRGRRLAGIRPAVRRCQADIALRRQSAAERLRPVTSHQRGGEMEYCDRRAIRRPRPRPGRKTLADLFPLAARKHGAQARRDLQGRRRASGSRRPTPRSARSSAALARADRPRDREGRQGRDPLQHAARVDLLRLRRALGRRDRGPDLPDQLARGVPVRARELRRQVAVVVEDDEQLEKIREVRDAVPEARARDPDERHAPSDAISIDELAERGAGGSDAEWEARWSSVDPDDICTFIYTSGTTGPPKGCVISHGNYRSMLDMVHEVRRARATTRSPTSSCRSPTPSRC